MEIFERAARNGGVLLRVERLDVSGSVPVDEREASAFLLTFDVGRVLVSAHSAGGALSVLHIDDPEHAPSGLEDAAEGEPWWRVIGNPVKRVDSDATSPGADDAKRVTLQFRADDANPRRIALAVEAGRVRASLQ